MVVGRAIWETPAKGETMAVNNLGGEPKGFPDWARTKNLRIIFDYDGPSETAKQHFGYRWEDSGYSLEWLHRRVTGYDRNMAREFKARGANAGCLVWSTGFSLENDQYHWSIVRRRIEEFHALGMKLMVYISLTNCFWKEMFPRVPECQAWRQVGPEGEPVPYGGISYGGRAVTRYLMCVNNPRWRAYQKRRIKAAVEAGVDGVFWDNNFSKCHCPICQEKFRRFTLRRLGQAHDIPMPLAQANPPSQQDLRSAREVVFDWIPLSHPLARVHLAKNLFRYLSIMDILGELRRYAEGLKPDIVWSSNGHLCQHIYDRTNLLLSEDLAQPGYDAKTGRLRTNAGVLRYLYEECGRETPSIVNSYHPETLAYGASGYDRRTPEVNELVKRHPRLVAGAQSLARAALVAGEMNYINHRSNWFDNLVRHHILYDVIPMHRLGRFDLARYDVVLLRSLLFLSDRDCRQLRAFVRGGGTLIATNATSLYDENWARRQDYGLADVLGASAASADTPIRACHGGPGAPGSRVEHAFGRGRSIFYPGAVEVEIEADPLGPAAESIARDVRAALRDPLVEVQAPPGVAVNLMYAQAGLVVHVLNYTGKLVGPIRVRLTPGALAFAAEATAVVVPARRETLAPPTAPKLRQVMPIGKGSRRVTDVAASAGGVSFRLARVDSYTAIVVR